MVGGSPPCIRYNVVNLPDTIQFTAGHQNYYTYDASGKKLEVQNITSRNILNLPQDTITRLVSSTKLTTDYCGDAIYQNDTLKEVLTPEGYWQNGLYYYYLKDHQGSTRKVLRQDNTVMEYSDYYPDGMRFWTSTSNSAALPYRYNGKEMEAMNGLNEYDYGARRRETGIPVWTTPDPLCEMDYSISPYAYCMDNPINKTDPNGMACYGLGDNGKGDDDPLKRTHLDLHPPFGSTSQPWNDDKSIPEDVQDILDKINRSGKDDDFSHQPSYWYWAGNDKGRGKEKGNTKDKKTDKSKDQYGEIVAYVCISAGAAFGGGGSFEFGYVITNKNYAQYYITLSGMVGLATSVQAALGNIIPIKGKPIKLSDWMGSSTSVGVSTPFVGGQVGLNDNYSSPAVTVGLGVQYKAKLSGNLTTGKTMLIGSPVNPEQFSLDLTNPFNTSY